MQILFNKTIEQCRQLGARGGRAYARNRRLRESQVPLTPVAQFSAPPLETAHQASLQLDAQFPWLEGAFLVALPVTSGQESHRGVAGSPAVARLGPCRMLSAKNVPIASGDTNNCKPSKLTAAPSKNQRMHYNR